MAIRKELLDELIASCEGSEDLLGPDGLLKQLKGALVERMLQEEMTRPPGPREGRTGRTPRLERPQWLDPEDAEERRRRASDSGSEGPRRKFRAESGAEASAPLRRFR